MPRPNATPLALLQAVAGPEMMAAAMPIVQERLKLTPEKLALLLVRILNPDEVISQGEECRLRGVADHKTLKGYKEERLFPRFVNGICP